MIKGCIDRMLNSSIENNCIAKKQKNFMVISNHKQVAKNSLISIMGDITCEDIRTMSRNDYYGDDSEIN